MAGLYDNIHAKRKRRGITMAAPRKGKAKVKDAAKTAKLPKRGQRAAKNKKK